MFRPLTLSYGFQGPEGETASPAHFWSLRTSFPSYPWLDAGPVRLKGLGNEVSSLDRSYKYVLERKEFMRVIFGGKHVALSPIILSNILIGLTGF